MTSRSACLVKARFASVGSLFVTRPRLVDYIRGRNDLAAAASAFFALVADGIVTAEVGQMFALADAVAAQRAMEARTTTGSTVLRV